MQEGKYVEALGKWEAAIVLVPTRAVLHEQKSQVLLELGRMWMAVQAATRRFLHAFSCYYSFYLSLPLHS